MEGVEEGFLPAEMVIRFSAISEPVLQVEVATHQGLFNDWVGRSSLMSVGQNMGAQRVGGRKWYMR